MAVYCIPCLYGLRPLEDWRGLRSPGSIITAADVSLESDVQEPVLQPSLVGRLEDGAKRLGSLCRKDLPGCRTFPFLAWSSSVGTAGVFLTALMSIAK